MRKIGMLTIGQSPRDDIMSVMGRYLPTDVEVIQRGALDGLELPEVDELGPRAGERPLVSTMRDGTEVTLTHRSVVPLMQEGVDALADQGAESIVILCTGGFGELRSDRATLVDAGSLIRGVVTSLAKNARLGVIQPSAGQVPKTTAEAAEIWGGLDVVMTSASPYAGPEASARDWDHAAEELREENVDLVLLNCMGMDESMKQVVRRVTQKPVMLASAVVARMVDELLGRDEVEAEVPLSRAGAF